MPTEATARIKINKLLEESGWRLYDESPQKLANVTYENKVSIKRADAENDQDFAQHTGFVDYVLWDDVLEKPVAVLEAKRESKDPLDGKEQSREYAQQLKTRYIILSNGTIHYFWDLELGNPTRISSFPTLVTLQEGEKFVPNQSRLLEEIVTEDYIVRTQDPKYDQDPRWYNESERSNYIYDKQFRFLRHYQLNAVKAVQQAVGEDKNRFLLEMATGTGKTLTAAAIMKLFIRTKNARRVLFLVDRLELENQAKKDFDGNLAPDFTTVIYKENKEDWKMADIVVTTIQSLAANNKYLTKFSPNDFGLIISDEAHRSISGNSRVIFEYFIGYKLGLTATPKDYLKHVDLALLAEEDPRALEKRQLLSTYVTFGCENGEPTFRYSLLDGVRDGFLVNPHRVDCRTEVTTELLSEEGFTLPTLTEEEDKGETFKETDFEKKFTSEETNKRFVEAFLQNAERDPISGEVGKGIIYCVSQKHARKIAQLLNEYAHQLYPGKYNSDFAVQITSNIGGAQQFAIQFSNNNLNGTSRFLEGYKTSKTRICVTVAMMTTGYDCKDLLNIAFMRPVFSPTDFVQMKGRGTRTWKFKFTQTTDGESEIVSRDKTHFKLFDYFAVCEYFEQEFPYDEVLVLPQSKSSVTRPAPGPLPEPVMARDGNGEYLGADTISLLNIIEVDQNGMRIDRELYAHKFEQALQKSYETSIVFKTAVEEGDIGTATTFVKTEIFDRPDEYFSMDKVRKAYKVDRRLFIQDIIDKVFHKRPFKTKEQLAEDDFKSFVVSGSVKPEEYYDVREFFKMYVTDETFRRDMNVGEYTKYTAAPETFELLRRLGKDRMHQVVEHIKDNIAIAKYQV